MHRKSIILTSEQLEIIEQPLFKKIFLHGPAGTGKTQVGVERLTYLLQKGIPGDEILVLVPQRTLAEPYFSALRSPDMVSGSQVTILTIGGLARRMVEYFWPMVIKTANFGNPHQPPIFLTLETAQYFMAHLMRPLLNQGYFEGIAIKHNRLYSQIIDNLNKAAMVGFEYTQFSERLKSAWTGDPGQEHIYDDAQQCANLFRKFCLEHNLLDFSLQVEVFIKNLWPTSICQEYIQKQFHHLIVDNLEEDVPVTYFLLESWFPQFDSGLIIFDEEAGFRRLLGADPDTTSQINILCNHQATLTKFFGISKEIKVLEKIMMSIPVQNNYESDEETHLALDAIKLPPEKIRYYPAMLDWTVDEINILIDSGVPPNEIVILAPYLSDALRFSLIERLLAYDLPHYSHRPSRSLREEPATKSLLTLSALAHPHWQNTLSIFDIAYMLMSVISGMDLIRAQLLAEIVFQVSKCRLSSFNKINTENQERITFLLGNRYEILRSWINDYAQHSPLEFDHFLGRLFGEVLSQPGFSFHDNLDSSKVTAQLVESVRKFRWVAGKYLESKSIPLGQEYFHMVQDGIIAAQYISSWSEPAEGAIFIAPASTFLMRNRSVSYQFWLDIGSRGWYERIRQPLTHPYVLSRQWNEFHPWTDANEFDYSQRTLSRLTSGLLRRCKHRVYLGISEFGEGGYEHKGMLLKNFDRALRAIYSTI